MSSRGDGEREGVRVFVSERERKTDIGKDRYTDQGTNMMQDWNENGKRESFQEIKTEKQHERERGKRRERELNREREINRERQRLKSSRENLE